MDKKKVLIVDDDANILEVLKSGLEMLGYSVDTADNPPKARMLIQQERPDIILMDVSLPGTDGISFCRDIRRAPETEDIPIIIVTAFSDTSTYNDAMLFGASDFIAKPFEMMDVKKKLEDSLARADAKRGTER